LQLSDLRVPIGECQTHRFVNRHVSMGGRQFSDLRYRVGPVTECLEDVIERHARTRLDAPCDKEAYAPMTKPLTVLMKPRSESRQRASRDWTSPALLLRRVDDFVLGAHLKLDHVGA
jgi:hypothetical protein